mgnify:CR=1 FL=1
MLREMLAISTAIWLTCGGAAFAKDARAIRLFNGKDFSGWTAVLEKEGKNADGHMVLGDVFHVRKGGVLFIDGKGAPYGYLRSERQFTNFRLHVEWRWTESNAKNNSGLYLRTAPGKGPNDGWPWTYEIENAEMDKFKVGDFVVIGYDIASFKTDPARIDDWGEKLNGYHGFVWKDAHRLRIADAEKRVSDVVEQAKNAKNKAIEAAKTAADAVRKTGVYVALWAFISLLVGAFSASYMATVGGRVRDDLPMAG